MSSSERSIVFGLLALSFSFPIHECVTRTYFIGIKEENWDYAPSGKNLINGKDIAEDPEAAVFLLQGPERIGRVYKKAVYKQYTDETYTQEVGKPRWLGFLGPVIRAEVDDVIVIHVKNFALRPYSLHPHGVLYGKTAEGALYPDGTSGNLKWDDGVPPGGNHTYRWFVTPDFAPGDGDGSCLTWMYHSHVHAPEDMASGLMGGLITCKKGTLQASSSQTQTGRNDVDKDFYLMFSVVDENTSWYLDENIKTFCSDADEIDPENEEFMLSNKMHAINGYVYGNLPGLEMCTNRSVAWHLIGMGNEVDVHSAHFYGHTILYHGHRDDVLNLFPTTLVNAKMLPGPTGEWMLACEVSTHLQSGMQAFFEVSSCGEGESFTAVPPSGQIRRYYIAAEEQLWTYAPLGVDAIENSSLTNADSPSELFFGKTGGRLGPTYLKARYVAYTDETFTTRKERSDAEKHLGILGPVIRAEVGDVIHVTFMNKAQRNYSVQTHGLQYDKASEGTLYGNDTEKPGASVRPGERFTYTWRIVEGPSTSDPSCICFLYYSATNPVRDTQSGLMGPLLVCKKNSLDHNGFQKVVDKEFFLLFTVFNENLSWYLDDNIATFGTNESDIDNEDFYASNKKHAINGLMYGNLAGLDLCMGDRVYWHTMGLGTELNMHGVHFEGNTFQRDGMTRDTLPVFPHTSATVLMVPDNAGTFKVSCKTINHYIGGMRQQYTVHKCRDAPYTATPSVLRYYIAAEEVEWDYSPSRIWELEKHNATAETSPGSIFVEKGDDRIGSKYKKALYREYTDDTFVTLKDRPPEEEHLAVLGPAIRAEVGERIVITFKNKASRPFSMYAHAVKTDTSFREPVQPGSVKQYQWDIEARSGPGTSDPNCICFAYYSALNYIKDIASGLIGPLIICQKGTLGKNRRRTDVDREFALLFMVFNENLSWYLEENIQIYVGKDSNDFPFTDKFEESNLMHAINGKVYGNLHNLTLIQGERVDWHILGMGNELEVHTVHFHGQTFIFKREQSHRSDVYDLFPATFQTVSMVALNPGNWLLHCHVDDHIHAGMETTFTVRKAEGSKTTPNAASPQIIELLPLKWTVTLPSLLGLLVSVL